MNPNKTTKQAKIIKKVEC